MNARSSLKTLIACTLALAAIVIAPGVPAAHAGPGEDSPDSDNQPSVPGPVQAPKPLPMAQPSENPVMFMPGQDTKTITFTWEPQPAKVYVTVHEDSIDLWHKSFAAGAHGPLNIRVRYGHYYSIRICREGEDKCPVYVVTTERFTLAGPTITPIPQRAPQIAIDDKPRTPQLNRTPQAR
jgi:hypothetical protein